MLTKKFAVYVPSTIDVDKPLDSNTLRQVVDSVLADMSRLFGGATAQEAEGAWLTEAGELVKEKVTIVYSYTDDTTAQKTADKVYSIARRLVAELKQEAVSVETPAGLDFVEPAEEQIA